MKVTEEKFYKRFKKSKSFQNVDIISEFKGMQERIRVKCKDCGKEWEAQARSIISGTSCKCQRHYISKNKFTHEKFLQEFEKRGRFKEVEIIGVYVNSETPIKMQMQEKFKTYMGSSSYYIAF